jgi:hypothetical protein
VRAGHRVRFAVNLANGSTLVGLGLGLAGRARLAGAPEGLLTGTGYRLPVPAVPAFTMGSVILTRRDSLPSDSVLFRHEARHSTQYACCGGVLMLPLYFAAAGVSWVLSGDVGAWNLFERRAGLADGGYADLPLRRVFQRRRGIVAAAPPGPREATQPARQATAADDRGPGQAPAERAGSTATPCR